jgi:signal transduction histidine kinase
MISRLPIRVRLSLLYGAIVFVVGAALMAVAYTIVERNLTIYSHRVTATHPTGRPPLSLPLRRRGQALAELEAFLKRQSRRQAAVEQRARINAQDSVAIEFLAALITLTVPSAALGYILAGRALRPVAAITAAAERVADGDLSNRIALAGPRDELRRLADAFDAMLERLEAAFARQQAFVANASHELKTPLAIVRAELDATLSDPLSGEEELREMATTISEATARSERLIEGLLILAQSERTALYRETVGLDDVADTVLSELCFEAEARSVRISAALDPAVAWADPVLVRSLVRNLLENAIRHNVRGGVVAITTSERHGSAVLTVENDGPPIPPTRVSHLFEPFRRLDRSATPAQGAGLGLAIARAVVASHGGEIRAKARPAGGLDVSAELPLPALAPRDKDPTSDLLPGDSSGQIGPGALDNQRLYPPEPG